MRAVLADFFVVARFELVDAPLLLGDGRVGGALLRCFAFTPLAALLTVAAVAVASAAPLAAFALALRPGLLLALRLSWLGLRLSLRRLSLLA